MRSRVLATALLLCASVGVVSCGAPDPKPLPVADQFVAAITSGDYAAAAKLTAVPAATLGAPYQQLLTATKAVKVAISLGTLVEDSSKKHASAPFQTTVTPEGYAPWTWAGTLPLDRVGKAWQVQWTPSLVHPQLIAGETFKITTSFGTRVRAQVLGAGGQVLVGVGDVYAIGITPGKMTDPTGEIATLAALLKPQGVTVADLTAKYTAGLAHPAQKIPIISLRALDFAPIEPKLFALAGVPYSRVSASIAETPTFAHALLGRVSAVTAEELATLGAGYTATSQVGQSGVEKAYEARLAGTPDASVVLVGADGKAVGAPLTTFPGVAGQPVTLTIDPKVQEAAETALGTVDSPVGDVTSLVAIKPSTGEVLAVANRPSSSSFDAGLEGRLPPGSTFKVVSSDGLLSAGVTPDTPVPCVPSINVGGQLFHNFQGESVAGTVPFSQDFAISCNTAFISLSSKLSSGRLETAAADFGLGGSWQVGLNVNHGAVPAAKDAAELASATIGQGQLAMSPLDMAMVAATVDSGTWRAPSLVTTPAPASPAPTPKALPAAVVTALQGLMRGVVTSGTGATAFKNFPGAPVSGKTGTAETADKTKTDAWFIGYRGDLAFAVVVQNGGIGGVVAAPLAAKFLTALG
ncbi:penicillin-binding transpeptidase domain-containing protein [Acidothermaceae bacterium B102]|nr:penicillin-binding transpeptidase domain-containing protein [Acidothermaceae bacterium B102]